MFGIMEPQTSTHASIFTQLIVARESAPACTPQDLGCEIAEAELASELAAPQLTADCAALPDVDPDEFDTIYNWFIS